MPMFRSTTALTLSIALVAQGPAFAQSGEGASDMAKQLAGDLGLEICDGSGAVPCVTDNATFLVDMPDAAAGLEACGEGQSLPCVTAEGFIEVEAESELAMQALATPSTAEAEAAQLTETAPAETAEAAPAETAEAAPAETIEAAPTDTTEAAPAETVEAAPAETVEAAPAETVEAAPEQAAEQVVADDAASAKDKKKKKIKNKDKKRAEQAADAAPIVVEEAPSAAAAATEEGAPAADTVIETEAVTEETSRSASEDFATSAAGTETATAKANKKKDKGLSNFEKALVLGLGAVVVGSILKNGDKVVSNSGDRVVLRDEQGDLRVLKDDDALLRRPGSEVRTETFNDGSTRTIVEREDGVKIVTIRASDGRVIRRAREFEDGTSIVLFDDTETSEPVIVSQLPEAEESMKVDVTDEDALRRALARAEARDIGRRFSLRQIRQIREVRQLAPEIELDSVTFASGSAAIQPSQAEELAALGRAMQRMIDERPGEVFLIEGHTDAVGSDSLNLALSDRRAETVALALAEYFGVPPENMITQGYGESELKIQTDEAERLNRRANVRRITPLLQQVARN